MPKTYELKECEQKVYAELLDNMNSSEAKTTSNTMGWVKNNNKNHLKNSLQVMTSNDFFTKMRMIKQGEWKSEWIQTPLADAINPEFRDLFEYTWNHENCKLLMEIVDIPLNWYVYDKKNPWRISKCAEI